MYLEDEPTGHKLVFVLLLELRDLLRELRLLLNLLQSRHVPEGIQNGLQDAVKQRN